MSARFQGRGRLTTDTCWAQSRDDIEAVVLVGSFAREGAGMASDVDLVILTPNFAQLAAHPNWFLQLRPGSQLIHAMAWGPLLERRYRMRSGLQVDVGLVPRVWLSCHSIRAHNESSRWAHRALGLTRTPISCRRSARQQSRVGRPSCGHSSGPVDGADRKPTVLRTSAGVRAGSYLDYHLSMLRTGLIVEVPDAEHVVAHWREQLDPHAMLGVPAHVTVLFPFAAPDRIDEGILTALRQVLSAVEPFEFRLPRTGWFGGSVLWLAPEPGAPFRHLTEVLTAAFPDYPPFGGQFAEIVPHLTVGDHGTEQQLSAAERDVQHHLPIHSNAQAVTLMAEQADGRWHRRARLAFGQRH